MNAPFITALVCFVIFVCIGVFAGLSKKLHQVLMVIVGVIGVVAFLWSIVPPPHATEVLITDKLSAQVSRELKMQGTYTVDIVKVPVTNGSDLAPAIIGIIRGADWPIAGIGTGHYDGAVRGVVIRVRHLAMLPPAADVLGGTLHNYGIPAEIVEGAVSNENADIDVIVAGQ